MSDVLLALAMSVFGTGNGVASAGRPGVASAQPAHAQPQAPYCAMRFNGFNGIRRAGGGKAAIMTQPGADKVSVKANRGN